MILRNRSDGGVVKEQRSVVGLLPAQLEKGRWSEGGVCGDCDALILRESKEIVLDEIWVMLDLENSWADLGVSEEIKDQGALEIGDPDALGEVLLDQFLHRLPCLLDTCIAELVILLSIIRPSWWVADSRVDVFQGDWEVDVEKVKVLKSPVGQLLTGDWLNMLLLVEGIPKLGNDEELVTRYKTVLDSTSNTLTSLDLISVIYR